MLSDRSERIQALISLAERFRDVPPEVAHRPFEESHRVPGCESEAFVWVVPNGEALDVHFAVENPQGLSAKALATILSEGLSGQPASEYGKLSDDLVTAIFGNELSMGKTLGLTMMIQMAKSLAAKQ
ncbi:MAG: hypothetical protein HONBIEJF_01574 [Fimbriimonadaceae bacterium]|nr:hypothetical protein [Fimbriimonadaceae bacterium]